MWQPLLDHPRANNLNTSLQVAPPLRQHRPPHWQALQHCHHHTQPHHNTQHLPLTPCCPAEAGKQAQAGQGGSAAKQPTLPNRPHPCSGYPTTHATLWSNLHSKHGRFFWHPCLPRSSVPCHRHACQWRVEHGSSCGPNLHTQSAHTRGHKPRRIAPNRERGSSSTRARRIGCCL
jgi:hypothetical protein